MRISIFGQMMHPNWKLALAFALMTVLVAGVMASDGVGRAKAHTDPVDCNAIAVQASIAQINLGPIAHGSALEYVVQYANPEGGGGFIPCNADGIFAEIAFADGSVIPTLDNATLSVGETINCPGDPECVDLGPYLFFVDHGFETGFPIPPCSDLAFDPEGSFINAWSRLTGILHQSDFNGPVIDCNSLATQVEHTPEISTEIHLEDHSVVTFGSANPGAVLHDSAVVAGALGIPTGEVEFNIFDNTTCAGSPTAIEVVVLTGGTAETSSQIVNTAGLSYLAQYLGDANYLPVTDSVCAWVSAIVVPDLELDFATVDWGQTAGGQTKLVAGNFIFESGGASQSPTIRNNSDHGVSIAAVFSPLAGDSEPPKFIDKFGACFGKSPATVQCFGLSDQFGPSGVPDDAVSALETVQFDNNPARVLCPGELGKLDLYVYPTIGIVQGIFSGSVEFTASPAPGVCVGDPGTATGVDVLNVPAVVVIAGISPVAPTIQCAWQYPDMQPGVSDGTVPDPTFQYGTAVSGHQHDDDMVLSPSVNPACSGPPGSQPSQVDGVTSMIQIAANPGDSPEERWVQLWSALEHPFGVQNIGNVYWNVFDPDGAFMTQVHGTKIGDSDAVKPSPGAFQGGASQIGFDLDNDALFGTVGLGAYERRISECGQLGLSTSAGSMFEAGAHIGELSGAAVDDVNLGIVARCMGNVTAVFYARFSISSNDLCGEYRVEANATSNEGNPAVVLNSFIDVACPVQQAPEISTEIHLDLDHADVTFSSVIPGSAVHDSVTVVGAGEVPIGDVEFNIYDNTTCAGSPTATEVVALTGGTAETSSQIVNMAGLSYLAQYLGDANYLPVTDSVCEWVSAIVVPDLELDFATVDWGQSAGGTKLIAGDFIFESGGESQNPTIRNNSDHGVSIALVFSPLTGDSEPPKFIDRFGACFGKSPSTVQCFGLSDQFGFSGVPDDAVSALETVQFDNNPARVLCPGELGKLDLYVHPKAGQNLGTYTGDVEITASPAPGVCVGDPGTATDVDVLNVAAVVEIAAVNDVAPAIQCAWESLDMQPGVFDFTTPDPNIQYGTVGFSHNHDDDMSLSPSVNPACFGPPGSPPSQADGATNMIQVMPLIGDFPEERLVQVWAALDHPNGIQNIGNAFWNIYHPDGSIKIQVHGTRIGDSDAAKPSPGFLDGGASPPDFDHDNDAFFGTVGLSAYERRISECGQIGQSNADGSMFEATAHIGELSGAAIDDVNLGIVARCMGNTTAVFYASFSISSLDPCGEYRIEAHATSNGGKPAVVLNSIIDVLCPELDTPEITTEIHLDGAHAGVTFSSVVPGTFVHDSAFVSGASGIATGDVVFDVYANTDCTGSPTATEVVALIGGNAETSSFAVPAAGLSYLAQYLGDSNYLPGAESVCEWVAPQGIPALELDFDTVNWGQADPGLGTIVPGNLSFDSGGQSQSPTVRNKGDHGIEISVVFSEMLDMNSPFPNKIGKYTACLGKSALTLQCIGQAEGLDPEGVALDAITAGETVEFASDSDRVLCPGEVGKLDLGLYPKLSLPAGSYSGSVAIIASPSSIACVNDTGPAPGVQIIDISAEVEILATGLSPNIECAWGLPDMQPGVTDSTAPDNAVQYTTSTSGHLHDDDVVLGLSTNPACSGPPGAVPSQIEGVRNMIQVTPNFNDLPEERLVQLWMAVNHPNGSGQINAAWWNLYRPDGTPKAQVNGTRVGARDSDSLTDHDNDEAFGSVGAPSAVVKIIECGGLGQSSSVGLMFEASVDIGELSGASIDDENVGIVARCMQDLTAVYYASFSISSDEPCGEYKIEAHAVSGGAEAPVLNSFIDVFCPVGSDIVAQPIDDTSGQTPVTMTFAEVTAPGGTSLTITTEGEAPTSGFALGDPPTYYELTTDADITGPIEICINYSGVSFVDELSLTLNHFEGGGWVIVETTSHDTDLDIICGSVSSLSAFAIFEVAPPDDTPPEIVPSVNGSLGENGWYVSDVTVSWSVIDPDSPINFTEGCSTVIQTVDTEALVLTCLAGSDGGESSESVTIKRDATAPIINLSGVTPVTVEAGDDYSDAGATALDDIDGDITANIIVVNPVDTTALGKYFVTYNVADNAGNAAIDVTRTVIVVDTTPPVITLVGFTQVDVEAGQPYADAGATASDTHDGDITAEIVTVNPIDTAVLGAYSVTYDVKDSSGNTAVQVTRTVTVVNTPPNITLVGPDPVTLDEGQTAPNSGTFSDANGDTVTLTASEGTVSDNGDGTWSWSFTTSDGPTESQTVTISADDGKGGTASVAFDLVVINVAPTVAADNSSVAVNEGEIANNIGTFSDPSVDTVAVTASVGTITQDATNETWSWTFGTSDGPDETQTVTITATDSDGAATDATFELVVINVAPTVAADIASVPADEGENAENTGTFSDPGTDIVTISASVGAVTQGDGAWSWTFDTSDGPDETKTVTITATDSDGAATDATFELVVINVAPTLIISGLPSVDEGSPYTLTVGDITDPGDDTVSLRIVNWGDGTSETFTAGPLTHTYVDGSSSHAITVDLEDEDGTFIDAAAGGASGVVTVLNVPPTVVSITVPSDPVNIGEQSSFVVDVSFTDPAGVNDEPYTCGFYLDGNVDGDADVTVSEVTGTTCSTPLNYTEPGVYTVAVTVTDNDGGSGSATATELIVIYDPAAGFATGGGWIIPGGNTSDDFDDLPGLDHSSKASFGFVVKYKNGANSPIGQLEFQYRVGNFNLHSIDYDWLVVTNQNKAKFQGLAIIDGEEGLLFPFRVDASDGDANATTLSDRFVIKIWDVGEDPDIVEDPLYKASGDLGGGKIIIHSNN